MEFLKNVSWPTVAVTIVVMVVILLVLGRK